MTEKKPKTYIYLPRGEAVYPALRKPDTRYDELGAYKIGVRVKDEDAVEAIKTLQGYAKTHTGKPLPADKNPCWFREVDDETGERTGYTVFKSKAKNKMRKDGKLWDRKPAVIDAKRTLIPDSVVPWGGSTVVVKAEVYFSQDREGKKGLSLQPTAVQVIKLVERPPGDGSTPDVSGFDADDEGYGYEGGPEDFGGDEGFGGNAPEGDLGDADY